MREVNAAIHNLPVLSYFAICASWLLGVVNLIAFLVDSIVLRMVTPTGMINLALGMLLTLSGMGAFVARKGGMWRKELRALPWLVGGAAATAVFYVLVEAHGLITNYAIGINVLILWTLWIRTIELSALDKGTKELLLLERDKIRFPVHV